jgi:cytochrome P450
MSTAALPPSLPRTPWGLWKVITDPDAILAEAVARCGDPFTDRLAGPATVFSATPEAARRLLTADPDLFEVPNRELMAPLVGDGSLALLVGARHRAERKLLNPHFHGGRMRAYGTLLRDITRRHISGLRVSDTFRMLDITQAISVEVILRAVFGVSSNRLDAFHHAVIDFVKAFSAPLVFFQGLRRPLAGIGPWDRFIEVRNRLHQMMDEETAQRREAVQAGRDPQDILGLLVRARYDDGSAMTQQQLRDELITLLFAGHETTAIALAWALYHLHKAPAMLERLRRELKTLGDEPEPEAVTQLPYLTALCKETLRLHPVAPILPPRQVREPFEFMGYNLPPGTLISIATLRLHKREDLYPAPLSFLPERFLQRSFTPFEYMPFGGGTRRCIGSEFAMYEMKMVLATLLSDCRLSLASDEIPREARRNLVLGPSNGVPMLLTARLS